MYHFNSHSDLKTEWEGKERGAINPFFLGSIHGKEGTSFIFRSCWDLAEMSKHLFYRIHLQTDSRQSEKHRARSTKTLRSNFLPRLLWVRRGLAYHSLFQISSCLNLHLCYLTEVVLSEESHWDSSVLLQHTAPTDAGAHEVHWPHSGEGGREAVRFPDLMGDFAGCMPL